MLEQLADYTVLELIIGERIVHYLTYEFHFLLYIVVLTYFVHAVLRYRQRKQLIELEKAQKGNTSHEISSKQAS